MIASDHLANRMRIERSRRKEGRLSSSRFRCTSFITKSIARSPTPIHCHRIIIFHHFIIFSFSHCSRHSPLFCLVSSRIVSTFRMSPLHPFSFRCLASRLYPFRNMYLFSHVCSYISLSNQLLFYSFLLRSLVSLCSTRPAFSLRAISDNAS